MQRIIDTPRVVSYSISTSNHNNLQSILLCLKLYLIPFLHQTTTVIIIGEKICWLYLIPFLHQTTTCFGIYRGYQCCILFHFYIKPQLLVPPQTCVECCILFHFYIKPQRGHGGYTNTICCILFHFYIKPQPMAHKTLFSSTLSPKSHSHFQRNAVV